MVSISEYKLTILFGNANFEVAGVIPWEQGPWESCLCCSGFPRDHKKSVMLHDESRFSLCCPSVEDEVYGVAFPSMEKQCFSPEEDISMRRVIKIRFYDQ